MLNLKDTLSDNFELIKEAISELNHFDKMIGEKELKFLLFDTYDEIFPEFAKNNIRPAKFVLECLERKDELLKELNRSHRLTIISLA